MKLKKNFCSPLLASSPASRQSSWPRRGCTSMTTCNKVEIRIRSNKTLIFAPSPISHTRTTSMSTKFPCHCQASDRKANYLISVHVEIVPYQQLLLKRKITSNKCFLFKFLLILLRSTQKPNENIASLLASNCWVDPHIENAKKFAKTT